MNQRPDTKEKTIRFICGAFFGVLVAVYLFLDLFAESPITGIFLAVSLAGSCGFFATRFGDRFWSSLKDWF